MYVTRPLSLYKKSAEAVSQPPPRGPGSGFLVIQDEGSINQARSCFGIFKDVYLRYLPFPQDRRLTVQFSPDGSYIELDAVYFIPVVGLPLSSNRYYVVKAKGKHKGMVSTCSNEKKKICFNWRYVKDVKPKEFDLRNRYQQVEIVPSADCLGSDGGQFYAESIEQGGFPKSFLRRKGWSIYGSSSRHVHALGEALGVDDSIRAEKPADMDFFSGTRSPSVTVGKWYCPFIFVREEDMSLKDQVESKNIFYEMSLEQFWEEIYGCDNHHHGGDVVKVHAEINSERPLLHLHGEEEASADSIEEGVKWFRSKKRTQGGGVGLDAVIAERMRWEAERVGWIAGVGRIERAEKHHGRKGDVWRKFHCYVLVERFALRRMDGSLIFTCDFRYVNEVRSKWE